MSAFFPKPILWGIQKNLYILKVKVTKKIGTLRGPLSIYS